MTTIAFDGRYVAADTAGFCGDTIVREKIVKLCRSPDALYTLSGNLATLGSWIKFHEEKTKTPPKGDGNFIVFSRSCEWRMFSDESLDPIQMKDVHAWGSGEKYAITAMDCGRIAREAVEMAARRDPFTGIEYGVTVFDLVDWAFVE